ncbi:hypothetical protein [Richelia intracellularis]|uniref:hypothetical protein n=1 Tax=Richelia intracellularis TaxID=1164990 RepID=UPI0018C8C232|nr:hypothetical protein [Richelia intracellularis]
MWPITTILAENVVNQILSSKSSTETTQFFSMFKFTQYKHAYNDPDHLIIHEFAIQRFPRYFGAKFPLVWQEN